MAPFSVLVHPYKSRLADACIYEHTTTFPAAPGNAIVFIGGLGDGPHTVPYIRTIAQHLAQTAPSLDYSVFEVRLSSSFDSFAFKRLSDDVTDLTAIVRYLRTELGRKKIVFLGHSTGCQDAMAYAGSADAAPAVDGFILQGPVSDREAFMTMFPPGMYEKSLAAAETLIREGRENDIMPREYLLDVFPQPHTAYRWHSFISKNGDDDYFSSDLPDERLSASWGAFSKPVLILPSAEDEYVPKSIDVAANMKRWKSFCPPGVYSELSGQIPGATHRVEKHEARLWMADRVIRFLENLEQD